MAFQRYVSFKGETQGQIKGGDETAKRGDKWCVAQSFEFGAQVPIDFNSNSGKPKGPRTHSPIVITKPTDSASPQLLNAHWNSELLNEIVIETVGRPDSGKGETVVERITLTNAVISSIKRYVGTVAGASSDKSSSSKLLEEYGFIFQNVQRDLFGRK
jgi:type VI secretion system secreted protein Hcp